MHSPARTRIARFAAARTLAVFVAVVVSAASVAVLAVAPAGASPLTWHLASDLLANASSSSPTNPFADTYGNAGTWRMLGAPGTARDPSTYGLLTAFERNTCGRPGFAGWTSPLLPVGAYSNTTSSTISGMGCAPFQLLPSHQAFAHPGPSNLAVYSWTSPLTGSVRVSGGIADADCGGGNGVAWYIDQGATPVASGSIPNCGSQAFPAGLSVAVAAGDSLYVAIDPKGEFSFDQTAVDLTIEALDVTAPAISGLASPAANAAGWNNTPVTVTFTCTDAESGVASCQSPTALSSEGAGQIVTGTASDNAGNHGSATVGPIDIDLTAPSITGESTPPPNLDGWSNVDVTVHWTCADDLSGIAGPCPADTVVEGEGPDLAASASVSDRAGNSTSATTLVKIDRTAPLTTVTAPSAWSRGTVSVTFDAFDNLSGVQSTHFVVDGGSDQQGTDATIGPDGDHTLQFWSVDRAGNLETPHTVHVLVDQTSPVITHTLTPPANGNGWNNSPATVTFLCSDGLSGIASCTEPSTVATEGLAQPVDGTAIDAAGNSATDTASVSIDATPPTIAGAVTPAPNVAGWYRSPVTVTFTCADPLSGVAACSGQETFVSDGADQSATGTATDAADNTAFVAITGLDVDQTPAVVSAPVPADGASYTVGQVVPAEYSCSDALSGMDSCAGTVPVGAPIDTDTAGTRTFVVIATDLAGNVSTQTETYTVTTPSTQPTTTVLASSANPSVLNGSVAFTATVSASAGTPAGTVRWQVDGSDLGLPVALDATGKALISVATLTLTNATPHQISAIYAGSPGFAGSAATLAQSVAYAGGMCVGSPGHQILQPVNADGTSVFKSKSTVAAKLRVCDANGSSIGTSGVIASFRLTQTINGTVVSSVDEAVDSSNPDTAFRWDPASQQWVYNISTKAMAVALTYVYTITLNDGSTVHFQFGLR